MKRFFIIVLDGVGCGAAADAAAYGDVGSDTIGNVARAAGGLTLPNMQALGWGNLHAIQGLAPAGSEKNCRSSSDVAPTPGLAEAAGSMLG